MQEIIRDLLSVQELDLKVLQLRRELAELAEKKKSLLAGLEGKKERLKSLQKEHLQVQMKRKEKEIELETRENEVKKFQVQLLQIKTNKEYASLQHEISSRKTDNSQLEDAILALMEEGDQVKAEIDREKNLLAAEEVKVKREEVEIAGEAGKREAEITALLQEKTARAKKLNPDILEMYEQISSSREGQVVVAVENNNCQGCFHLVRPQMLNEVKKSEQLIRCENCSRILYAPDGQ